MYVEALYNVKSLQQPHITIALRGTVALRHRREPVCVCVGLRPGLLRRAGCQSQRGLSEVGKKAVHHLGVT